MQGKLERPGRLADLVKRAKQSENKILTEKMSELDKVNAKLTGLIRSKYRDVAQSLLGEIRVFSGANSVVFLLLAIIALVWERSAMLPFACPCPPGARLTAATPFPHQLSTMRIKTCSTRSWLASAVLAWRSSFCRVTPPFLV